jgi:ABC-type dipeptide/oligopeptide/nickel transport system permease component
MIKYLTQRVLIAIPSLLGISVVAFTVLALAPGDPFRASEIRDRSIIELNERLAGKIWSQPDLESAGLITGADSVGENGP